MMNLFLRAMTALDIMIVVQACKKSDIGIEFLSIFWLLLLLSAF